MPANFLIGLTAGLIAAVVFVSATTGPLAMRVLLFLLTPLSLFLAGLGWSWTAALIGGIAGTLALALATTPGIGMVFAIAHAIPVAILSYLVTLNRPAAGPGPDTDPATRLEWYPVGRIVIWAAAISGAMALAAMVMIGPDIETLKVTVRKLIDEVFKAQIEAVNGGKQLGEEELAKLTDVGLYLLPAATALSWMSTILLNLWLAGRITAASGKLQRPWPDIAAMRFPRLAPAVLALSTAATFLTGYPALAAAAISGAFYFAYVLMGLAVIHYITRGQPWRPFVLWALYGALFILNTGVSLVIAILGLADSFIAIRKPQQPHGGPGPPV